MGWFSDLISNPFFITSMTSWLIAQTLKVFINAAVNSQWDWSRLWGDGGMPSGHSATVASMAVISALVYGTGSFHFALSATLAIVVCHDAMGIRREAGKQAAVINEILKSFSALAERKVTEVKLKEFVGHTPLQVLSGILIGIGNAFIMYHIFF